MPKPSTCLDCMEEGNLEVPTWKKALDSGMRSKFEESICRSCGDSIYRGDLIYRWDRGDETMWIHSGCVPNK